MKLVAAARFKRAQDRVVASRPYAARMREIIALLAEGVGEDAHPLLQRRETERRCAVLVIASDRGLCGGFNTGILRLAMEFINSMGKERVMLMACGRKVTQFMTRRGVPAQREYTLPLSGADPSHARQIARDASALFISGEIDAFYVIYSRFRSALVQMPTVTQLLPIEKPDTPVNALHGEFILEPSPDQLLGDLLPRYLYNLVYQALLESAASEHGARMTAMAAATDNAGQMISTLTQTANQIRQTAITTEILEVVSGAEAIKDN